MVEESAVLNKRSASLSQNFLVSSLFKEAVFQRGQVCMSSCRLNVIKISYNLPHCTCLDIMKAAR